ncbi:MAG: SAM-dependent DNA methyltransferase [Nitrospiraceae bacterium]
MEKVAKQLSRNFERRKRLGLVFTPGDVARALVNWVIHRSSERLLDPACGDGRFIECHRSSVGVEIDKDSTSTARQRAPWSRIHEGDFFLWASETRERFEAAAGNPPFIRYQHFSGVVRERALKEAAKLGARFNRLTSSWAPFLAVTAGLLKPGGRMAFVVPAEIGHAPYAVPVLDAFCSHFDRVQIVAVREKLFPELSEDAWLLYAEGFGGHTDFLDLSILERFAYSDVPPKPDKRVSLTAWRRGGYRLRRFLLPQALLDLYAELGGRHGVARLGDVAQAGIGYVSGANDFFHLRPSEARKCAFPDRVLKVTVRKAGQLPEEKVDAATVRQWLRQDEPVLLLNLGGLQTITPEVKRYLDSEPGQRARVAYKCRTRDPWYVVPDVRVPHAFLSYMSGTRPSLVRNDARCVCTNSVHAVLVKPLYNVRVIQRAWRHPLVDLSCELEGHPLGGGMLKLEPREAASIRLPITSLSLSAGDEDLIRQAAWEMRRWRHHDREFGPA